MTAIEQELVSSKNNHMNIVTSGEIEQFREQLRDYPEAIADLDVIEACEGDLERSARVLARRAGAEDDRYELPRPATQRSGFLHPRQQVEISDASSGLVASVLRNSCESWVMK